MAKKKLKKFLKKAAKAALIGGALYGGSKLLKSRKAKSIADMDNAGIHVRHNAMKDFGPYTHKRFDPTTVNPNFSLPGAKDGGRIGKKHGGRVKSMGVAKRGGGVAKR